VGLAHDDGAKRRGVEEERCTTTTTAVEIATQKHLKVDDQLRAIMADVDIGENVASKSGAGGAGAVVVPKACDSGPRCGVGVTDGGDGDIGLNRTHRIEKDVDKSTGRAVETQDVVACETGDVQVAVRAKD
jgi:hypothetical protein